MKSQRISIPSLAIALLLGFSLTGCEKLSGLFGMGEAGPKAVAKEFWEATKTGKAASLRPLVTQKSLQSDMLKSDAKEAPAGNYQLGEVQINDNRAIIPTTLKDPNMGSDLQLSTILLKEEGEWKVDLDETMMTMFGSAMEMLEKLETAGKTTPAQKAAPAALSSPQSGYIAGQPVLIEWKGTWWPGRIKRAVSNDRYEITYDGYSSSWDEVVGPDRLKLK